MKDMKEMKDMKGKDKHHGMHMKHKGTMMVILGGLILANVYWIKLGWGAFVGGVLVIGGLVKMSHSGMCRGK